MSGFALYYVYWTRVLTQDPHYSVSFMIRGIGTISAAKIHFFCTTELWQQHHWSSLHLLCLHPQTPWNGHFHPPCCRLLSLLQRKTQMRTKSAKKSDEGWCTYESTDSVKQTFQLLLLAPLRKFLTDPSNKIDQDVSALAEMFNTVPITLRSVSTSIWSNINLQKWEWNGMKHTSVSGL